MNEPLLVRVGARIAALSAVEPVRSSCRRALDGLIVDPPVAAVAMRLEVTARDRRWRASLDGEPFGPSSADAGDVVDRIVSWCTRTAAADPAAEVVVSLHAAGVVGGDGAALVVAGSSGAGKTTVTAAALLGGWGLLSDELVGLDGAGGAVGHPKALTLKPPTDRLLGPQLAPPPADAHRHRWYVPAGDLAAQVVDAAPIGAVLVLTAEAAAPVRLSPAVAVVELARHAPVALDARRLVALASLADSVPVFRVGRHDPTELLDIGRSAMGAVAAPPSVRPRRDATARSADDPRSVSSRRVAVQLVEPRGPMGARDGGPAVSEGTVAVAVNDAMVVLGPDGVVLALDTVAATLWHLLDGSTSISDLVAEVAAIDGTDPTTVATAITSMLDELRRAGVVAG